MYNNLNGYGIPMTLDMVIKMCQNEISSKVIAAKYTVLKKNGNSDTCIFGMKTDEGVVCSILFMN
jgi:hypothetical protein